MTNPEYDNNQHVPYVQGPESHVVGPPMPPEPQAPKKKRTWLIVTIAVVLFLILCVAGIAAVAGGDNAKHGFEDGKSGKKVTTSAPNAQPAVEEPASVYNNNPTKSDFKLGIKVLKKECFGSAGCLVDYRINVTMTNPTPLDPSKTYEITYQVKGAEDPIINTLTVTGDRASVEEEESTQTKSSSSKLTVVVTEVAEL